MRSSAVWDKEYRDPQFVSRDTEPAKAVKAFVAWLRKSRNCTHVALALDAGVGIGKNATYLFEMLADRVVGYDTSREAIKQAQTLAPFLDLAVHSIADPLPLADGSVEVVVDWMTSHLLTPTAYAQYVKELARVVPVGGVVCVRTFRREGDTNAGHLIKTYNKTKNTYMHPVLGCEERVFTRESLSASWAPYFVPVYMEAEVGYQKWGTQSYKRHYWVAYFERSA